MNLRKLEEFLAGTDDRDPVVKAVRELIKKEIARLEKLRQHGGRPKLEDTPQRVKWREYQRAYRAKRREG